MRSHFRTSLSFLALILMGATPFVVQASDTNETTAPVGKSRVVLVRESDAVNSFNVDTNKVRLMISAGIKALTSESEDSLAWRHFVSRGDVVGIKINTQSGPLQSTRRAVVDAIAEGLQAAGVRGSSIYVFDRDPMQMRSAGYLQASSSSFIREVSIIDGTGWDPTVYYQNNLAGRLIWGDLLFGKEDEEDISKRSHLPKIVTRTVNKLINVPVLQDHDICGLAGCLFNLALGMVDNTRRFDMPAQRGDPMIAEICAMQPVHGKLVLNIMDGLIAGYAGGPTFKPQYSSNNGALYFSADPVAVDTLCVEALDAKRKSAKIPSVGSRASHIASAARLGLGMSQTNQIDLITLKP